MGLVFTLLEYYLESSGHKITVTSLTKKVQMHNHLLLIFQTDRHRQAQTGTDMHRQAQRLIQAQIGSYRHK